MIPATHITINNNGHAWWIPTDDEFGDDVLVDAIRDDDRPCDTCDGNQLVEAVKGMPSEGSDKCADCIDGRYTWTIEVECDWCNGNTPPDKIVAAPCHRCSGQKIRRLRVSVVPGMVLPIEPNQRWNGDPETRVICVDGDGDHWIRHHRKATRITLPHTARPGMTAVQLRWEPV